MLELEHEALQLAGIRTDIYYFAVCKWGEGNGIPLQYSCLENPMDGGAWKSMGSLRVRHD